MAKSRLGNQPAGQKENAAERRVNALNLRKSGASFRQIGDQLGVDAATAYRDVQRALADLAKEQRESAEQLRQLELERLDALQIALWVQARQGNQGAVDRVLRIMERRARLLGLDAPTKADITSGGQPLIFKVVYADEIESLGDDGNHTDRDPG